MNETNPTDFVISDLTPQRYWQQQPTVDESAWLERIAVLPTEPFLLATGLGLGASSDEPVLHRDVDGWRAGRFIGEIHHAGRTLKILPRLGLETLTAWISAIYNVKVIPHAAGRGTPTAPLVIQLAAAMWRAAVLDAGKHALPRVKVDQVHYGLQVRGRLDVAGTARARLRGVREVASVDRRRSLTNPAVTSVVSADRILDRHLESSHWRGQRIEEQLVAMRAAVGSHPELPKRHDLRRMRYSPITAKWRRAAELSHMIASSEVFKHSPTAETTHGLLIDVAELWELFLTACAARATEATIVHGTRTDSDRALLTSFTKPGRVLGRLYVACQRDGTAVLPAGRDHLGVCVSITGAHRWCQGQRSR